MLNTGDSWVTLTEANSYFSKKWGAQEDWASLIDSEKESLLITAKNFILNLGYDISDDNTTDKVKRSQLETSYFIYKFYAQWLKRSNLIASGVKDFKVMSFTETLGEAKLPVYISNNLEEYLINQNTIISKLERDIND